LLPLVWRLCSHPDVPDDQDSSTILHHLVGLFFPQTDQKAILTALHTSITSAFLGAMDCWLSVPSSVQWELLAGPATLQHPPGLAYWPSSYFGDDLATPPPAESYGGPGTIPLGVASSPRGRRSVSRFFTSATHRRCPSAAGALRTHHRCPPRA